LKRETWRNPDWSDTPLPLSCERKPDGRPIFIAKFSQ
jgi:hypothetical protein